MENSLQPSAKELASAYMPYPEDPEETEAVAREVGADRPVFPLDGVIRVCLTLLTLLALIASADLGRSFLLPTFFAVVLTLILRPIVAQIERAHIHSGVASAVVLFGTIGALIALLALAAPAITNFADQAPQIMRKIDYKISGVRESVAAIKAATDKVEKMADPGPEPKPGDAPPQQVVVQQTSLFAQVATTTPAALAQFGYAVVLAFFLLTGRDRLRKSFLRVPPTINTKVHLARFMRDVGKGVSRYMLTTVSIATGVACLSALVLVTIGLPNALIWGAIMGLGTLIPFFGPIIAMLSVAGASIIAFPDLEYALLAPGALLLIHVCESQIVTPNLVGRLCVLNPVVVFFGVSFMAWLWGPVGAFVAVPGLILLATAARHTPSLYWLEALVTGEDPQARTA